MSTTVEYLNHSGYLVETEEHMILFDYVKGELPKLDKPTLVIVTHGHKDHFNPEILNLKGDVKILLSSDIKEEYDIKHQSNVFYIDKDEKRYIGDFQVETFGSTDAGMSAFVYVDNTGIFHAGDLNLWIWPEDTKEERKEMTEDFSDEVRKIRRKNVEIAMFPADPRMGEYAISGLIYFIDSVKPNHLFPMHFWDNFDALEDYKDKVNTGKTKFYIPKKDNEKFEISTHPE